MAPIPPFPSAWDSIEHFHGRSPGFASSPGDLLPILKRQWIMIIGSALQWRDRVRLARTSLLTWIAMNHLPKHHKNLIQLATCYYMQPMKAIKIYDRTRNRANFQVCFQTAPSLQTPIPVAFQLECLSIVNPFHVA